MFCGNKKAKTVTKKVITTHIEETTEVSQYKGLSSYVYELTEEDKKNI